MRWSLPLIAVMSLLGSAGCASPLRASSHPYLAAGDGMKLLALGSDEAQARVVALFAQRGYALVGRRTLRDGTVQLQIKGRRSSVRSVAVYGQLVVASDSVVGSVFYVRLRTAGASTVVRMHGKPTLDGYEICADTDTLEDVEGCREFEVNSLWHGHAQMTGREEAEVVRGVTLELTPTKKGAPAPSEPVPPPSSVTTL
jgi:hypothetical protein